MASASPVDRGAPTNITPDEDEGLADVYVLAPVSVHTMNSRLLDPKSPQLRRSDQAS